MSEPRDPVESLPGPLRSFASRVVVFAFVTGWGLFEFALGNTIWALLFVGAGVAWGWTFLRPRH